jgi:hypothetical protein
MPFYIICNQENTFAKVCPRCLQMGSSYLSVSAAVLENLTCGGASEGMRMLDQYFVG